MWDGGKEDETDGPTSLTMVGEEPLEGVLCLSDPGRMESLLRRSPFVSFGLSPSLEAVEMYDNQY